MDNEIEDFDTFFNRRIKSDSSDGGIAVSDKEATKKKTDKDSFETYFQERTGTPLTSQSRQDLNLTGSTYTPVESTTIGSGVLGSGNFIKPAPAAHESEIDKIANVPYSDQKTRGFNTEILKAYSDPKTLKEVEEKVKWYVPTDEQLRVLQTHDREKTTKQALSELGGSAFEAFTQGPGLVGDMLKGAYGIGKGLTTGALAATHAPIVNKFGDQAAKDRVSQAIDEGVRSGRVLADAALSTGEAILEPIQRMAKGGSSWADAILDKSEAERFQNYKNRYISRVADYEAKEINPAVLARFTNWISNQNFYVPPEDIGYVDPIRPEEMKVMSGPLVRELGAGLMSYLTPSVEERLARNNGDRQAAAIEKQTEDMAASNSMVDAAIANANRLVEDPSQVGLVGLVTPFNEFAVAGMLAKGAGAGLRAGIQGARELGKTAEEINKLRSLQAAKAMEKAGTAAQALEKAGYLEQALEGTAKGVEYVGDTGQRLFNLVPEGIRPIAKQGAALAGLTGAGIGLGALVDEEGAGAGLGAAAYLGSKFPGVASDLLKARRLAAGKIGTLEAASMLPNEMRAATTALTKFAGPKGDFFINNAKDFLKSNIDMAPLAVALGVYNDEDIKGIGRTIVEGGFLAGAHQLWGKAMGKDPIALERQNKARNLAAEKALLAASPEHRSNIDNLNWDRVVEQREIAAKKLERDHAIAAAENPDSPDAQRLFEQKENANRMYREAMGASVETRKRFAEEMRAYFGDAEAHINGVLSPGSNTKIELLTTDQIKDRFTTSGGQAPTAGDLLPFTDSEGISISGGRPVDRPWFGNLKDQIVINYDKLIANSKLTGEALPTVLSHEVGHDLWKRKEYRTLMMPSYVELFGNEVQDEQGNVVAGKAGMYSDDALFSMYGEKYLSKYKDDPEAVKQFAIASGLWDYENNTINRKSAIQYMKEEVLADAYTSNLDLAPDSPMRASLKWVESKITSESLKRVLRALNSMGVDPFVGEATGAVYTPEVRNMVREAQRLIEKHNGLFEDVDPENPDPQPVITKKDILASKDLLQKYHSDSGKFVTTPSLVVIDADGKVIGQRPITTPNVFEGQWDYVADENGEIKPVQKRGYGPLPPEAEGMNIPEGATIRIQREIAYDKDGKPIEKSNSQTIEDIVARDAAIRDAIVAASDGTPGEVKPFTASGMSLRGRLTQKQRAAIMALPESMVSLATKEKLFKIMDTIAKDDGSRLNTEYAARLNDKGGYTPFRREMRDFTPVSITFSKDGHFLVNTFSVSGLNRKLSLWKQYMPGKFAPWNGDMKAFNADFQKYLKNWEPIWEDADGNRRARPGQSDLDVDPQIAIAKKNVFNDLIGVSSEEFNPEVSELPRRRFTRAQKQRAKQSDPNTIFRSYRLDAMTDLIDSPVPEKYRIDYGLAKINFKPEGAKEDIRVETVDPSSISFKEKDQERGRINAIKQAYGNDPSEIDWDTQPKPIVSIDSEGKMQVEDGHHRLSAFSELGYKDVPVIIVPKDEWDALEKEKGLSGAGVTVAEQIGDEYTAGQDSYQGSRKPSGTIESDTTILSSNPLATNAIYVPPAAESFEVQDGQTRFMPSKEESTEKTKKMSSLRVRVTREALTDAALSQASWKDWYSEHQETLDNFFGDNAPLFQNILAITSQAASVKANVGLALKAFGQLMRGEEFSGYLPAVAGNLGKLRDATGPSGQKIQAYKAANEGDASSVVVDRHIARMLFGVDTPTPKQFAKASKVLTEIADKIGWTPAQVQAALWAHSIVQSGKQPESYGNYLKRLESQGGITKRIGSFGERGAGSDVVGGQRGRYSPNDEGIVSRIASADSDLAQTKFMPSKGDTWTEIKDAPTITLRDLIGRKVFPTFADLTSAGRIYKGIDSSEIAIPIETHGGPEWPLIQPEKVGEETNVWSNQGAGVSTTKAKRASEGAVMLVTTMSKDAHISNTEVANAIIATNLAYVRDKRISSKNAKKLDSVIKKELPDFPGFQSSDVSDYIKDLPFQGENSRARLSQILSQKDAEELGAANVQRILDEMRSPDYEGARIGDAVMAIELTPGAPVLKLGEQGTMTHPSYQYAVRGKVIGKFARPINWEMIYDDFLSSRRAAGKDTKGDRRAIDLAKPLQLITEEIANRIPQEQYKNIKSARHAQVLMQAVNGEWRSSDGKIKDGAVSPSDFINTLNASDAKQALDKYTLKGITEKIKKGEITLHQLADSQVYFATKPGDPATGYGKNPKDFGFGDNEKTLSLVLNGERGTAGMGDAIVQKALQEGVTALDCFAVKSEQYPDGMLPALYGRFGFEVVGEIPFDPSYYSELEVKDLKKFWRKNGWDESTGYPPVVLMKWRGNDKQRQSTLLELAGQNPQGIRRGTELFIEDAEGGIERPDRRQSSGSEGRLLEGDAGRTGGVQEPPLSGIQLGRGTVGAIKELLGMPKDALRNLGLDPDMVKKFQPPTPPLGELSLPK